MSLAAAPWLPSLAPWRCQVAQPLVRDELSNAYFTAGRLADGAGVGTARTALQSGAAEYLEREHLFFGIVPELDGRFGDWLPGARGERLGEALAALQEHAEPTRQTSWREHRFQLSAVTTLDGRGACAYPTALISTQSFGMEADRQYIPYVDSSGSAIHFDDWLARRNAASEFMERQWVLAVWFGASVVSIDLAQAARWLAPRTSAIVRRLTAAGVVKVFTRRADADLCPGYFCLALYQGHEGSEVLYSVGSSFRGTPGGALNKALEELWHGVTYQGHVAFFGAAASMDGMKQGFVTANARDTVEEFPCWRAAPTSLALPEFLAAPDWEVDDPFRVLRGAFGTSLIYRRRSGRAVFCRVLDPSFFLHMNPAMPLNVDNPFTRALRLDVTPARRAPIPFP